MPIVAIAPLPLAEVVAVETGEDVTTALPFQVAFAAPDIVTGWPTGRANGGVYASVSTPDETPPKYALSEIGCWIGDATRISPHAPSVQSLADTAIPGTEVELPAPNPPVPNPPAPKPVSPEEPPTEKL